MFTAIYSINNDNRYPGRFETLVDTDDALDIERMINIQHYPFTVTVHKILKK